MPRSQNSRKSNSNEEDLCVVCFREAEIFSIGECDHPVCHECSTRMRVLCGRTECPICRKDMSMVVFTGKIQQFSSIQYRNMKCEQRYSIYFENDDIMRAYDNLLEHSCRFCESRHKFNNFNNLRDHMRKIHEKFYCDLCVDNLKIFTHERRCYSRSLLAQHRRVGDTDDKSHRGHPLCEFCDARFMDNDELFRHLRRDHYFCHFCDADGQHHYYDDYEALRDHFRKDHFLCEEGNCREERFTSAFRTKLDLQAHTTQTHGHGMSKSEARQARTVDIAFTLNHRQGQYPERGRGGGRREGRGGRRQPPETEEVAAPVAPVHPQMMSRQQAIDINCKQDFPSLGGKGLGGGEGSSANKSIAHKLAQQNRFTIRTSRGNPLSEEEFPSLGSTTSVSVTSAPTSAPNPSNASSPTTSVHFSVNTKKSNNQIHNTQGASSGPNVSIQYNCTNPSLTSPQSKLSQTTGKGKSSKPSIGSVSHSGNITVKSSSGTGTRPKPNLVEDFPSLQPPSKPYQSHVQTLNTSWVPSSAPVNVSSSTATQKGPNKSVNSSAPTPKSPKEMFQSGDFPSLAPCTESQMEKLNYSGRSSLTIPMKKASQNENKGIENDENSVGGKGKKKKKGAMVGKTNSFEVNKNSQNVPSQKPTKKKPFTLSNIYDNVDEEGPVEDFSKGKLGEYEAVVPTLSSNIRLVSAANDSNIKTSTKKSELQIGNLKTPEFSTDEFPSLDLGRPPPKGPKKAVKHPSTPQESDSGSPVSCWAPSSQPSKKRPSIPPGFSKKSPSVVPSEFTDTDMTFTSSLGQKFAISPTSEEAASLKPKKKGKGSKPSGFILPPNFDQRNKVLIDAIQSACEGNSEKFNRFKHLAEIFRSGEIKGREYYEKCRQVMGKKVFHTILPELLSLLPDIEKQQGVLDAYRKVDGGRGCNACFAICAVCQQVLISDDFSIHMTSHEFPPDEYPSLAPSATPLQRRK